LFGHLDKPGEAARDRLLQPDFIDREFEDEILTLTRLTVALELENSRLFLKILVGRAISRRDDALNKRMRLVMRDESAQCLLANGLVRCDRSDDVLDFLRALAGTTPTEWTKGPVTALRALAHVLAGPDDIVARSQLLESVNGWPGWQNGDCWPIRPADSLDTIQVRLTDLAAEALEVADKRICRRDLLGEDLLKAWPPLEGFSFRRDPKARPLAPDSKTAKDRQ
jgi:hypothetical protein